MFGDDAYKEQLEWMKNAMFPSNTDPKEVIEILQDINDNLEFFESGASKLLERELIKDVIAKNLQWEMKAEFIRNKEHNCIDIDKAIKIIQACKGYVKIRTKINVAKNETKKNVEVRQREYLPQAQDSEMVWMPGQWEQPKLHWSQRREEKNGRKILRKQKQDKQGKKYLNQVKEKWGLCL